MCRLPRLAFGLLVFTIVASPAMAASLEWYGSADNLWGTAGNWAPAQMPSTTTGSPDDLTFGTQDLNGDSLSIGTNVFYVNDWTIGADGAAPQFGVTNKYLAQYSAGGKIVMQAIGDDLPSITAHMLASNDYSGTNDYREIQIDAPIELQADTTIERVGAIVSGGKPRRMQIYSDVSGTANLTLSGHCSGSWHGAICWYGNNTFTGDVTVVGDTHLYLLRSSAFGNPANQVTMTGDGTTNMEFAGMTSGSVVPNDMALPTTGSGYLGLGWGWNDSTPTNRDCTWSGDFTGGRTNSEMLRFWNRDWRRLFMTGENSTFTGRVGLYDGTEVILGGANAQGVAWENVEQVRLNTSHLDGEKTTAFLLRGDYRFNAPIEVSNSAGVSVATVGQMNGGSTSHNATFTGDVRVNEADFQALNLYAEAGGSARFQGGIHGTGGHGFSVNRSFDEIEGIAGTAQSRGYDSPTGAVILDAASRVSLSDGGTDSIGPVNVAAGTLQVDTDHFYASTLTIAPEATLAGVGTVAAAVSLGGIQAPGNSVGEQTVGSATWLAGASFEFEINDAEAGAGLGWDLLRVGEGAGTGILDLTQLSAASPFEIRIVSLDGDAAGNAANFHATVPQDWVFVTYDELADDFFDPNAFVIHTGEFQNALGEGYFTVTQADNGLAVHFVPEPAAALLFLTALALLLFRRPGR